MKAVEETDLGIDSVPPLIIALPLAVQHIFAAISGIVAVPIIVGAAIGLPMEAIAFLVSATLFVSGIVTIIQTRGLGPAGAKIPLIMGTDFAFVGPSIAVGTALGLPAVFGATLAGSFIEMFLSRFSGAIKKLFPPVVTGTVVTLIGLTIIPVAVDWAAGGAGSSDYASPLNILLASAVMVTIISLNLFTTGILSSGSILIGILVGYAIAWNAGLLDFSMVSEASWIALPVPFKFGIIFSWSSILAFIPAYVVTTVETIGDITAAGKAAGRTITSEHIRRGLLADGFGSFLAGIFNSGPNTTFSQNIGIISLTGVASRYITILAGIILMISGLFPKIGAFVAIIPAPVLGGASLIMFGMIAVSGIRMYSGMEFSKRN
ncbi:MAG: purine permease, partial [bacterium]|nr:purine permease [bacterium]